MIEVDLKDEGVKRCYILPDDPLYLVFGYDYDGDDLVNYIEMMEKEFNFIFPDNECELLNNDSATFLDFINYVHELREK